VEAIHFILLESVPTTIPTNCAHVRIPFETKSPKMLNNPRQRTRFRRESAYLVIPTSYEARDATAIVRPDFDNGVLLQVLPRLLLCGFFLGCGQIISGQRCAAKIDGKGNEF
jgi:hypothetical protein